MRTLIVRVLAIAVLSAFLLTGSVGSAAAQQDKLASVEAQISYRNGLLTITAKDCTLQEILEALQKQTGITVEMPSMEGGARMVAHFGPDTPDKVLAALLYGTKYNYILVGSNENADLVSRIVLMEKSAAADTPPPPPTPEPASADAVAKEQAGDDAKSDDAKKDANADGTEQAKNDDKAKDPNADANGDKDDKDKKVEKADAKDAANGGSSPKDATPDDSAKAGAIAVNNARPDVELTEDVLKKLPKLPDGIPSAMYSLYPQIVSGGLDAVGLQPPSMFPQANNNLNGNSAGANFQPGQLSSGPLQQQQGQRTINDWTIPPGLPPLPPGIDPRIWLLYPPNLLDLIRSAPPPPGH